MSVLASTVIAQIDSLLGSARWEDSQKLAALNAAIDGAWPQVRRIAQDVSQTIDSATYEYTPSATPEVEYGFAQAYATFTDLPDIPLRRVSQEQSGTSFIIHLDPTTAYQYHNYTLRLVYTARIPRITAASDSIELPLDYLYNAAASALMMNKMLNESKADVSAYEKAFVPFDQKAARALMTAQRGQIAHWITRVPDTGAGPLRVFQAGVVVV